MWLRASGRGPVVKLDWPYVGYRDVAAGYSKDTWRVYSRALDMMAREAREWTGRRRDVDALVAWHHLRFAVAFLLKREPRRVREIWSRLGADRLRRAVPRAAWRYLLPHWPAASPGECIAGWPGASRSPARPASWARPGRGCARSHPCARPLRGSPTPSRRP